MENEQQPIANRISPTLVEYVCPKCGWYDLTGVFREFLPFVDHLIQDYCFKYHPMLSQPGRTVRCGLENQERMTLSSDCHVISTILRTGDFTRGGQKTQPEAKLFF